MFMNWKWCTILIISQLCSTYIIITILCILLLWYYLHIIINALSRRLLLKLIYMENLNAD